MMLRIVPGENSGEISQELFTKNKITVSDIEIGSNETFRSKELFYFAMNNSFIVTNLSGTFPIDRLQTYINWLLENVRKNKLFEFSPVMTIPENIRVKDIKSIEFGNSMKVQTQASPNTDFATKMKELSSEALKSLFDSVGDFDDIQKEQLISAKLVLKIKRKPKDMSKDEYQRVMGALTKQITNDKGIMIRTKNGNSFDGSHIKKVKNVTIETTSNNHLVEEQLKQEMETFLTELE